MLLHMPGASAGKIHAGADLKMRRWNELEVLSGGLQAADWDLSSRHQ